MLCGGSIVNVLLLLLVPIVGGIPPIVPTSTMRAPSTHGATQFAAVYNGAMYLPVLLAEELEVRLTLKVSLMVAHPLPPFNPKTAKSHE